MRLQTTWVLFTLGLLQACAYDWSVQNSRNGRDAGSVDDAETDEALDAQSESTETDAAALPFIDADLGSSDSTTPESDGSAPDSSDSATPPSQPPAPGLVGWFKGEACTADGGVRCEDVSGSGGSLVASNVAGASLLMQGIGGLPTIQATGSRLALSLGGVRSDRFVMAFVSRVTPTTGQQVFLWSSAELTGGALRTAVLQILGAGANASFTWWTDENKAGPGAMIQAHYPLSPHTKPETSAILTLVGRGTQGTALYINGLLRASSNLAIPAFVLEGGGLSPASGSVGELAEALFYGRELSSEELTELHSYLAARFSIDVKAPMLWLDVDDIAGARLAADGTGPNSGHSFPSKDKIYDRALGTELAVFGQPGTPSGPSLFANGDSHRALDFAGSQLLYLPTPSVTTHFASGSTIPTRVSSCTTPDYLAIEAIRVDQTSGQAGLWTAILEEPAASLHLAVDAASGIVSAQWRATDGTTSTYSSPSGLLQHGKPTLLAVRSIREASETQVYLNGKLRIVIPRHACLSSASSAMRLGAGLTGAIAEHRFYDGNVTAARMDTLHQELSSKYSIALE